jgi:serine/threonine protein kinase/glyoxylase-like metal-dependent hydrolase (beta-lactamase superfamily II)
MSQHGQGAQPPSHLGPYTILRPLGEGAMGAVFLGRHDVLHTEHALKLLAPSLIHNTQARERFLREARHSARLEHPHIVRVFHADIDQGLPYIAMEYVKGSSIKAALAAGPLPPHRAVRYAYQVCLALGFAHSHGIIHRDVKPDNVLLSDGDMAKLTDFGLVLALNSADAALTGAGVAMGTPFFMSPEQWSNEDIDQRTDLYALGVMLFHMLSKRYPFEGDSPIQVVQRQLRSELLHLHSARPDIEPGLAMIVHRAMAHQPSQRFQSAEDLCAALARWWQQHPPFLPSLTLDRPARAHSEAHAAVFRQPTHRVNVSGDDASFPHAAHARTPAPPSTQPLPDAQSVPSVPTQLAIPRPHTSISAQKVDSPRVSGAASHGDVTPNLTHTAADLWAAPAPANPSAERVDQADQVASAELSDSAPRAAQQTASHMLQPIEIAPHTYWVGKREAGSVFFANPYLRVFEGDTPDGHRARHNLLIDPGSSSDFSEVRAKVERIIGGLDKLSLIFINHQDPDVGSSAAMICSRYNDRALIMTSEDTWRLIVHFNLPKQRCVFTEKYTTGFSLPTGHVLQPVPSPFCHFVGAVMLYDPQTRVLFSGDLFGGLTQRDAQGLWADESDWTGVRAFHQLYMPSNKALRRTVQAIRALDPPVEVIAPQHGRVLRGDLMHTFMRRIEQLEVGLDNLDDRLDTDHTLSAWNVVFARVLGVAVHALGPALLGRLQQDHILREDLSPDPDTAYGLRIVRYGRSSIERSVRLLVEDVPGHTANLIQYEAIAACHELDLPTPHLSIEEVHDASATLSL